MRQGGGQQGTLNSDGREVGRVFLSYRERLSREPLAGPGSETWLWRHLGPRGCQLGAAAWAPSPPKHTCSCWRVISGLSKLNASCSTVFFFFFGGGGRDGDSHTYKSIAILTWWWGEGTKLVPKGCGLG